MLGPGLCKYFLVILAEICLDETGRLDKAGIGYFSSPKLVRHG